MSDETNQTPTSQSNEPKMVPERDLLAVKVGAEKKEAELLTQVAEANRVKEETHNNLLAMQSAKEQIEAQLKEGIATKAQVDDLQAKLKTAEESVSGSEVKLLDLHKANVVATYGVDISTLAGKTKDQLNSLEEALKLVGNKPKPATLDVGGGGGGTATPVTALEYAKTEIAEARSKSK